MYKSMAIVLLQKVVRKKTQKFVVIIVAGFALRFNKQSSMKTSWKFWGLNQIILQLDIMAKDFLHF